MKVTFQMVITVLASPQNLCHCVLPIFSLLVFFTSVSFFPLIPISILFPVHNPLELVTPLKRRFPHLCLCTSAPFVLLLPYSQPVLHSALRFICQSHRGQFQFPTQNCFACSPKSFWGLADKRTVTVEKHRQTQSAEPECIRSLSSLKFSALEHQHVSSKACEHWLPGSQIQNFMSHTRIGQVSV